jgi:hypothetical protein
LYNDPIDHVALQAALKRDDEEAAKKLVGDELVELAPLGTLEEKLLAVRLALVAAQECE